MGDENLMRQSILVVAPALSISGYGEQARFAIDSLLKQGKYEVFVHNTTWGKSSWISSQHPMRPVVDSLIEKTNALPSGHICDISLQVTYPSEFKMYTNINIGYTAGIETNKVDRSWLVSCNMMDGIIVPSNHSKVVMEETMYETENKGVLRLDDPPTVVSFPPYCGEIDKSLSRSLKKKLGTTHNFLSIAQVSPRKNIYNLIRWFLAEFSSEEDVSLVLKVHRRDCSKIDRYNTAEKIESFISELAPEKKCKIVLLHGDMSDEEIQGLYKGGFITHYVSASHGEGFGLPLFYAACSGLVVVTHGWSGPADYLKDGSYVRVQHTLEPVNSNSVLAGIINKDSKWAYTEECDFRTSLRKSIVEYDSLESKAKKHSRWLKKKFKQNPPSDLFTKEVDKFIMKKEKQK